jgi:hypothetical protein
MYSRKETIMAKDSDSLGGAIGEALFYTFSVSLFYIFKKAKTNIFCK